MGMEYIYRYTSTPGLIYIPICSNAEFQAREPPLWPRFFTVYTVIRGEESWPQ